MLKPLADRAPFRGGPLFHPPDPVLTQAIYDRNGDVVRRCGSAIDIHAMAEDMNLRAAEVIMTAGTAAEESAWKTERYNK
jgi:hypothetical protein